MTVRVVSLGDSVSCGEGVGLAVPPERTWPALLAAALPGAELLPLAVAGSRVRDVRAQQLATAVAHEPHLATVLVGLNDVSRGGWCPQAFDVDLRHVVDRLRRTGATLLLGRLHDPCRHLPMPGGLRSRLTRRVAAVNASVGRAVADGDAGDALVLDLEQVPALRLRQAWAVDRLHPNAAAHALLARAAAVVLRDAGHAVEVPAPSPLPGAPSVLHEAWWGTRHGTPWLLAHARSVLLPALLAR